MPIFGLILVVGIQVDTWHLGEVEIKTVSRVVDLELYLKLIGQSSNIRVVIINKQGFNFLKAQVILEI